MVARRGSNVTVTGTSGVDTVDFAPGHSGQPDHTFVVNGIEFAYDPGEVDTFRFNAGEDEDRAVIHDSEDNDLLAASGNSATLSSGALFEAVLTDFEEIKAISELGGDDQVDQEAVDFVLTLEGPWDDI